MVWLLIIIVTICLPVAHKRIDAATWCLSRNLTWTVYNPKLKGQERIWAEKHEQKHIEQIRDQGCWRVQVSRLHSDKRYQLEYEAYLAEIQ